jgi:hypothetical protein
MSQPNRRPLQNRVTPTGEIIADAARGTMFGNRGGRIHGAGQRLGSKRWHSKQWICCVLDFKGRRRPVMAPNRYTELFFLDEATALSAGHRPCFECRRDAAMHFATLWNTVRGLPGRAAAPLMDEQLHQERIREPVGAAGRGPVWTTRCGDLPDFTFVRWPHALSQPGPPDASPDATEDALDHVPFPPSLLCGHRLHGWTISGYGRALRISPDAVLEVLTPKSIVMILAAGYQPVLHSSLKV